MYEIGYEYSMSKRTTLKALYSKVDNAGGASFDFLFGVNNSNSSGMAGTVNPGSSVSGVALGLRHTF
jgi:predicted porin